MGPLTCLRHVPGDDVGVGEQVARDAGLELRYAGPLDDPPPGVDEMSGLVVLGGEMNVDETDDHPFLLSERDLVCAAVARGVPVLGICLGAQMVARALGAEVREASVRELGFVPVARTSALDGDPLFGGFRSGDRLFQWHQDTFALPEGATLLLTGSDVHNQAFRAGSAWGMQFHAEVSPEKFERWLAEGEPTLRAWGADLDTLRRDAALHLPTQVTRFRQAFKAFVQLLPPA